MSTVTWSDLTHLECSRCERTADADEVAQLCGRCGSPLLARYDLEAARKTLTKRDVSHRIGSLWRYHELLPVRDAGNAVSLGEGMTPLIPVPIDNRSGNLPYLFIKDDGVIPTGTFKGRGAAIGVSRARELAVTTLAMPTNGNAGGAWATYCATAGLAAHIVMPREAPRICRAETSIAGANLYLVDGLIADAGVIVERAVERHGWFDASTLKEPYRLEGKKTLAFEIAEQLDWVLPDVIVCPTGGGVGIIGIQKGVQELRAVGLVDSDAPRLVAVQATGCKPIVEAFERGDHEATPAENPHTIAFGINVAKTLGDFLILQALYETGGCAVAVDDAEILAAQRELAQHGIFACPEGAATLAAAQLLRADGRLAAGERVVLLNTGTGLKYADLVDVDAPVLTADGDIDL